MISNHGRTGVSTLALLGATMALGQTTTNPMQQAFDAPGVKAGVVAFVNAAAQKASLGIKAADVVFVADGGSGSLKVTGADKAYWLNYGADYKGFFSSVAGVTDPNAAYQKVANYILTTNAPISIDTYNTTNGEWANGATRSSVWSGENLKEAGVVIKLGVGRDDNPLDGSWRPDVVAALPDGADITKDWAIGCIELLDNPKNATFYLHRKDHESTIMVVDAPGMPRVFWEFQDEQGFRAIYNNYAQSMTQLHQDNPRGIPAGARKEAMKAALKAANVPLGHFAFVITIASNGKPVYLQVAGDGDLARPKVNEEKTLQSDDGGSPLPR